MCVVISISPPCGFSTMRHSVRNPVSLPLEGISGKTQPVTRVILIEADPVDRTATDEECPQGMKQLLPVRLSRAQARQPNLPASREALLSHGQQRGFRPYLHEDFISL